MRTLFSILFLSISGLIFSQDTTVAWLNTIDTSTFTIQYKKENIPTEFYSIIGIEKSGDIANANQPYQKGCTGTGLLPMKRLNWIASDQNNHWILSVSSGGRSNQTRYYFIDKEKGVPNTNCFYFYEPGFRDLTLGMAILRLEQKQYDRAQLY